MSEVRKCVVWDLDDTLWDGVCLEGAVTVKKDVATAIKELDRRGILHSIASRGDEELALKTLRENGLEAFFLVPQINWQAKSKNIITIARELGLPLGAMAFVDDDEFEREQVAYLLPDVLTIKSEQAAELPDFADFSPEVISSEARERRRFYQADLLRKKSELGFSSREEFLISCEMRLHLRRLEETDIPRVLELMTRTHQLNTTGLVLDKDDLLRTSREDRGTETVIIAELQDRFGTYGIIGTAFFETRKPVWRLRYLAVSCRVMGRGIERSILSSLVRSAHREGFRTAEAEFRDTGRNRMMRALYQMNGFRIDRRDADPGLLIFTAQCNDVPDVPRWVSIV